MLRSDLSRRRPVLRRISTRDLLARLDGTGAVVDHEALAGRALPRNLDRAHWMPVTGGHPVDKDKGAHHREGEDDASTNDDLEYDGLPGAIFHHPT